MSDGRTEEQREADDALTDAINRVLVAYHDYDSETPLLTEYLVIATQRGFADDGTGITSTASIPRDNNVPLHVLLGLTEYAATCYRKRIGED